MLESLKPYAGLLGRLLLSAIFLMSGVAKLADWPGTAEKMAAEGMVAVPLLLAGAVAFELAGGAALLFGCWTRSAAVALILFLVPATLIFHDFWTFTGPPREARMMHFVKNLAILGGLFKFAADGAGRISFDARRAPPGPAHRRPPGRGPPGARGVRPGTGPYIQRGGPTTARQPKPDEPKPDAEGQKLPPVQTPPGQKTVGGREPDLQPAEEWGERLDTGKNIARGGKEEGHVPGAEPAQ